MAGLTRKLRKSVASQPKAPDPSEEDPGQRRVAVRIALIATLAMVLLRLHTARGLGFGDAEALYACYALHPQPAYLDHPGLIGSIARWLGGGNAPAPEAAHAFTAVAASVVPWLGGLAARAAGASWRHAMYSVLALLLVPELSIGLFALSPDLPLAIAWMGALALFIVAIRSEPGSFRALLASLGVGVLVGLASLSKLSGVLLGAALLVASLSPPLRRRWRTAAPWGALALALVLVLPVAAWEAQHGFPMLEHRLVSSQAEAGFSLRNLGALIGGQLLYISPFFFAAAIVLLVDLTKQRSVDPISRSLWLGCVVPGIPLLVLCLWSKVAEPHWLAPAYLPLAIHLARRPVVRRWLGITALVSGGVIAAFAWAWIKTPLPLRLLGDSYRPRYDLANDLHAWGPGRRLVGDAVDQAMLATRRLPVVVGPHYIVCAQAHAALQQRAPVGCNTVIRDDFDRWYPRQKWLDAPVVLYVTDNRFDVDPATELPNRKVTAVSRTDIQRDGRIIRTIRVVRLEKTQAVGRAGQPD